MSTGSAPGCLVSWSLLSWHLLSWRLLSSVGVLRLATPGTLRLILMRLIRIALRLIAMRLI